MKDNESINHKTLTTKDLIDIEKHFSKMNRIVEKSLTPEQETARKALHEELNRQFDMPSPESEEISLTKDSDMDILEP